MKKKNYAQFELALPPSINDAPFFHVRRSNANAPTLRRSKRSNARWWFQQLHAIIDSIPDPVAPVKPF